MHVFIAVVIGLFVGAVLGYAFRGYISKEKAAIGAAAQKTVEGVAKKL